MLDRSSRGVVTESGGKTVRLAALLGLGLLAACSAIVDTNADQCSTDSDCVALGSAFVGTVCAQNVCVTPPGGGGGSGGGAGGSGGQAGEGGGGAGGAVGCTTSQECVAQKGDFFICRRSDGQCVSLLSAECTTVEGDYKNDNAVLIGSVLPTQGSDSSNGIPNQNGMILALRAINQEAGGLPPARAGSPSRPLVLVGCSDNSDGDTAVRAAQHLVNDVKVPAILGAAFSGITIKMTTQVTIPAGVLTISPSATSVAITTLSDNNLVWRTSPSDVIQASAIVALMPFIESKVRKQAKIATGAPIKVAIFNKGDSYGVGLAEALQEQLVFNGKPALENDGNFVRFDYGNPDDAQSKPTKYDQAIATALGEKPHLIFAFGTNESITEVFAKIEDQWAETAFRPQYVFADGGLIPEVADSARALESKLGVKVYDRILGTVPGTTNLNFKAFAAGYKSQFNDNSSPDVFGAAGSYDAGFLLAYAMASLGEQPITGAAIAQGLSKVVPAGTTVKAGTTQLSQAFALVSQGQNIDYDGASGPLNFDLTTGEAPSDIQFWCVKGVDGKATTNITSTSYYDAAQGQVQLTDAIGSTCGF